MKIDHNRANEFVLQGLKIDLVQEANRLTVNNTMKKLIPFLIPLAPVGCFLAALWLSDLNLASKMWVTGFYIGCYTLVVDILRHIKN